MKTVIHIVAFVLLVIIYVATSSALAFSFITPLITGTGAPTLAAHDGKSTELPRPVFVQRRHTPLVKLVVFSPAVPKTDTFCVSRNIVEVIPRTDMCALPKAPPRFRQHGRSPPTC
ncbi:MAG: hypothetical protein IT282_03785 [Bacteroidetes bacterium]|nr:hypothetical protein [Bacteroidota bacterium]